MGIRSTLAAVLSAPLAAVLERRIRGVVEEVLDARDLADPASVRDLSIQVEQVRRGVEALEAEVAACREALTGAAEPAGHEEVLLRLAGLAAEDEEITRQLAEVHERLQGLSDRVVALRQLVDAAPGAAAAPEQAERAAPAAEQDRGCKVPGCTQEHRARGFCARHYQMWKRGTLAGFVNADGTVFFSDGERRWRVDPSLAGELAERGARGVKVGGRKVPADPV